MNIFSRISIRNRFVILGLFFVMCLIGVQIYNTYFTNAVLNDIVYKDYEKQSLQGIKETLKNIVDIEAGILEKELSGMTSLEEKNATVTSQTDPIRFFEDKSGYFFTYDLNGKRVNVPINKNLNGKDCLELKDQKGFLFVEAFVKTAKDGSGYVTYYFEKEGKGVQPKLSYVKLIPGTTVLIGTGVYIDNINDEVDKFKSSINTDMSSKRSYLIIAFAVATCVISLIIYFFSSAIIKPINLLRQSASIIANGDLSHRSKIQTQDEIGKLSRSLNSMADTISNLNTNIASTANKAASGFLRSTIDDTGFEGDYKSLISSINNWVKSMLMLIDKVPSPIMIRDTNRNMRFLNAAGSLGVVDVGRLDGLKCESHFKTEDCVNGKCACDVAFKSHKDESSSTVARPLPDVEMDVEYKAIPFGDDAVFEFVTDHSDIMRVQRKVVEIASRADQVAGHVASASDELSAQVEQSSRGSQEQSHRVGETATAMEEMNATVLEVAKNASQAAETAENAKQKAENGASIVKQVVKGIADVQKQALELKTNMTTLGTQAQGIGQVMNVINDIADQTNLLALNAAIEAARAGDAGRGFAVVADEVRKLAEKTMAATKEVGDAIHGIQDGTKLNIATVEQTVTTIENATILANQSGESLSEIVTLVDMTTDQVRSIATASEQQSAASEEINRSIEDISRISTETSEAMHQSSLAVTELANQSQVLSQLIEEMQSGGGSNPAGHTASKSPRRPQPNRLKALN